MTLLDTRVIEIHQSDVASMELCPARKGLQIHPAYDPTPAQATSWGSLEHGLIDTYIGGTDATKWTVGEILDFWAEQAKAKDDFDLLAMAPTQHLANWAFEARDALELWVAQVWDHWQYATVIAVEQVMSTDIGQTRSGATVRLVGSPDLVVPGQLIDWKSSGRGWDQGKADTRIQGPFYTVLAEATYPDEVGVVDEMTYYVYDRSKRKWSPVRQTITRPQVTAAILAALQWAEMIEHDIYPPTPAAPSGKAGRGWWCSARYCNAWDVCPYKGLVNDGVALDEPRHKGWEA